MKQYLELCRNVLENGVWKDPARPGMPRTKSINSVMVKYNLEEGFPLLTTKKMYTKGIFTELLWLLRGETNIYYLLANNCHIWDGDGYKFYKKHAIAAGTKVMSFEEWVQACTKNPRPEGELGKIYGYQWRKRQRDQILYIINGIKANPNSRYHILESWNADDVADNAAALPPCHKQMQFFVRGEYLDMMFYVRSNDLPLGNPFNVPCYAAILMLIAKITGYKPGILTYVGGDVHIYENQIAGIEEQIQRTPKQLPTLTIDTPPVDLFWKDNKFNFDAWLSHLTWESFKIENYDPYPAIKIPLSVGI